MGQCLGRTRLICAAGDHLLQLQQVFHNLFSNAAEAMETGGSLVISTWADICTIGRHKPMVHIAVADTGCGISGDIVDQIFDPFFTTKQPDVGTGMGLAVVYGIVTSWGGSIHVQSEPGAGSVFTVTLPVANAQPVRASDATVELVPGVGNILFVDDEEMLSDVGRRMLESLGYEVCACGNGHDALEAFRADPGGFDLVITDCAMPRMSGEILVGEIRALRPDMPVVMCTGYSETMTAERAREVGASHLLAKPFNFADLAMVVRTVLQG